MLNWGASVSRFTFQGLRSYGFGFRVGSWVQGFGISIRALGRVYDFGFGL